MTVTNPNEMSFIYESDSIEIREVYEANLEKEFAFIREIVDEYPYVAMDTEFPGCVVKALGDSKNANDLEYRTLKENVNLLKLIQLGLTLFNDEGGLPTCGSDKYCIWQFNFCNFNLDEDIYAHDSIELLRKCGIDFERFREKGVDAKRFGELLMSSGVVLNYNMTWVTFHSGYDFGYLVKVLTCRNIPETREDFFKLINMYFPTIYDIKHFVKFKDNLHGGLNKLSESLGLKRVGVSHQAGSDSLLTSCAFRKLKHVHFGGLLEKYAGVVCGVGDD